jgi:hypothetical protein
MSGELECSTTSMRRHHKAVSLEHEHRALIRVELDARRPPLLSGPDELRSILDPADVYGPDFSGETFRVLNEKEIKQFDEYRTRQLVLEA